MAPDPVRWFRSSAKRRELTRILAQNPQNALAARQLAMLQLDANAPAAARAVLELAKARSADAETLFLLGAAHVRAGDPAAGLKELDDAIALDDRIRYGDAHLMRGVALQKQKKLDDAAAALRRFVGINGSSIEGHVRLARVEAALDHKDAAKAARKEAAQTWAALPPFQRRQQRLWWLRMISGL